MAQSLQFELVSPEKLLLSEAVEMVVVPGGEGDFGVLPGHALMISTVRPGVIAVYEGSEVSERIFVSGGFAEVGPERCTVLADEAIPVSSLDRAKVEEEVRALDLSLAAQKVEVGKATGTNQERGLAELTLTERRLAVATAKLAAFTE
ncbi:MAG TPA: ATP synthase F1 subunit epsilon [Stellaceae bacterium]|nr:ATP synthase F1 subunit epsilon [Stellaceae bacterium]